MNTSTHYQWRVILTLVAVGLIKPFLFFLGLKLGWVNYLAEAIIAVIWVGVVVLRKVPQPVITLLITGVILGILTVTIQQVLWATFWVNVPAFSSIQFLSPVAHIITVVSTVLYSIISGIVLGLIALGICHLQTTQSET